jgi:hypothetical protein
VSEDTHKSLASIRSLASRLNELTEQANHTIRTIESFLDECSVGITTYVSVETPNPQSPAGLYLGYLRVKGRYRIAVVESDDMGEDTAVRPWSDCTRDEKVKTFEKLPDLLNSLTKNLTSKIKATETTTQAVAQALKAVGSN